MVVIHIDAARRTYHRNRAIVVKQELAPDASERTVDRQSITGGQEHERHRAVMQLSLIGHGQEHVGTKRHYIGMTGITYHTRSGSNLIGHGISKDCGTDTVAGIQHFIEFGGINLWCGKGHHTNRALSRVEMSVGITAVSHHHRMAIVTGH